MANTSASERSESSDESAMDLRPSLCDKDRNTKFWNTSSMSKKFSVEQQWLKRVRGKQQPKNKIAGWQKAEMAGPLVDS